jgi:hypothetical protein
VANVELMELPKITPVEIQELKTYETQALSVTDEAKMVAKAIHDAATNEAATQWVTAKKAWCKNIKEGWLGQQANRIFKMHREWTSKINDLVHPVEGKDGRGGAVGIVIDAQLAYKRAEDKRIAEANAARLLEARKKDEEERLKAAEKLEAQGNTTMANAVLSQVGNFVPPKLEESSTVPTRKVWKIRFDPMKKSELIKMIGERPHLQKFLIVDEKAIEKQVALMDGNLFLEDGKTPWPGVTAYQDDIPFYRGR